MADEFSLVADEFVLPLSHLPLAGLLPLLELGAVCLTVLQQSHHRAERDLPVSLIRVERVHQEHWFNELLGDVDLSEFEDVLRFDSIFPAASQKQHHGLVHLRLLARRQFFFGHIFIEPFTHSLESWPNLQRECVNIIGFNVENNVLLHNYLLILQLRSLRY